MAAIGEGDTISLGGAITTTSICEITKSVTINIPSGQTWTNSTSTIFSVDSSNSGTADEVKLTITGAGTLTESASSTLSTEKSGNHAIYVSGSGCSVEIQGVTVSSKNKTLLIKNGGNATLTSGTLTSNGTAGNERSVWIDGAGSKFTMNGGEILCDNSTSGLTLDNDTGIQGVRVFGAGTFEMTGGIIHSKFASSYADNKKPCDGGVLLFGGGGGGTFIMTGGTIYTQNYFALQVTVQLRQQITQLMEQPFPLPATPKSFPIVITRFMPRRFTARLQSVKKVQPINRITGKNGAVELRAGELIVNGGTLQAGIYSGNSVSGSGSSATYTEGTFTVANNYYSCAKNNNGDTSSGAAIAVSHYNTNPQSPLSVTINGGEFNGAVALSVVNPNNATNTTVPEITINGGTFTGHITSISGRSSDSDSSSSSSSSSGSSSSGSSSSTDTRVETDKIENGQTAFAVNVSDSRVSLNVNGGTFNGSVKQIV